MPQITDGGTGTAILRYWVDERRSEVLVASEPFTKVFPKIDRAGRYLYYLQGAGSGVNADVIQRDLANGGGTRIAVASFTLTLRRTASSW